MLPSLIPLDPEHVPATPAAFRADGDCMPRSLPQTGSHTATEHTVSSAELTPMDHLTREAIDERLRILENVSVTIDRCVADLVRVRSSLPISLSTALPSTTDPIQCEVLRCLTGNGTNILLAHQTPQGDTARKGEADTQPSEISHEHHEQVGS